MNVDVALGGDPRQVPAAARIAEENGFSAGWVPENKHDAFIALALGAASTTRLQLGSSVAVALARNPMTIAIAANDVHLTSRGRLILGLGANLKQHIVERFGMTWSAPAARMREFVAALRAIWASWTSGERLDFRGDYYAHTLMTDAFAPGPNPYGWPPIFLAGIGRRMTSTAGESADGLICHPFTSVKYLESVTLPALHDGLRRGGRSRSDIQVTLAPLIVTGRTEDEFARRRREVRSSLARYCGSPHRRGVMSASGLDDLHRELKTLEQSGRRAEMTSLIDDSVLSEFAVVAEPGAVISAVKARFEGILDRVSIPIAVAVT